MAAVPACCSYAWIWRTIAAFDGFRGRFWREQPAVVRSTRVGEGSHAGAVRGRRAVPAAAEHPCGPPPLGGAPRGRRW